MEYKTYNTMIGTSNDFIQYVPIYFLCLEANSRLHMIQAIDSVSCSRAVLSILQI
jgi:hypothetical protein